jgi:two-component system, chemotaxis family, protein-glutamate methylesterase/glutaminase
MIDVLIVDDSPVARQFLQHVMGSDPELRVVGAVASGREAMDFMARCKPDVVTMDIHMPGMDGFEATRRIMEDNPVPIVMISACYEPGEVDIAFRALQEGAVAIQARPVAIGHAQHRKQVEAVCRTVRLMAGVKVSRRLAPRRSQPGRAAQVAGAYEVVAVGASTGGPPVLQTILSQIPAGFPLPVVIVQHISAGFVRGMVEWLNGTSRIPVSVATDGEELLPGHAYVAPDANDITVDASRHVRLSADPPAAGGVQPSVARLFRSIAASFGNRSIGVLLTGMGKDGAEELNLMRTKGALTIVQCRESCVVFGMPGEAVRLGAAVHELSPEQIAGALAALAKRRQS